MWLQTWYVLACQWTTMEVKVMEIYHQSRNRLNCRDAHVNRIRLIAQPNTLYTHSLCKHKLLFWMQLIAINQFDSPNCFYFNIFKNWMYSSDAKLNFQHHYVSLQHHTSDPSEILLICWFAVQETFLIIISVENSCAAEYFYENNSLFCSGFFDE